VEELNKQLTDALNSAYNRTMDEFPAMKMFQVEVLKVIRNIAIVQAMKHKESYRQKVERTCEFMNREGVEILIAGCTWSKIMGQPVGCDVDERPGRNN